MDDDPVNASTSQPFEWVATTRRPPAWTAAAWLRSRALTRLAGRADNAQLLAWSARTLDTRRGEERHNAPVSAWDDVLVDRVVDAATQLGLISTAAPLMTAYDSTILLGGTALGNRLRTELACEIAATGVKLGQLVAATAQRIIEPAERRNEALAVDETFEWQNLVASIEHSFGPAEPNQTETSGRDLEAEFLAGVQPVRLMIAPPSQPRRRATTDDAIRFVVKRLEPSELGRVLLITSAIYAPYQFFVAAPRLLAHGARHVELIGTPTALGGDRRALAQRLGQEIHAAIAAATPLVEPDSTSAGTP